MIELIGETVLIVMRTRWRRHMLPRALRSVLAQTHPHWSLRIVNDGGPAHLVDAEIEPYRHLFEGRLSVLHLDRQFGMEAASNAGLRSATSQFIVIHDDDDTWHPDFLASMVRWLRSSGARAAVCRSQQVKEVWNGFEYVSEEVTELGPMVERITAADLADQNLFPPIALMFRRDLLDQVGAFDERLPALGDWHFNKRIARIEPISVLPQSLARWHHRGPDDSIQNSPQIDHIRFQEFVKAWPAPAKLPDFFPEGREVRLFGPGDALAAFQRFARPGAATQPLPPGLYIIHFRPRARGKRAVFLYRSMPGFSSQNCVLLNPLQSSGTSVLINTHDPIQELAYMVQSSGPMALPPDSAIFRLGNPLGQLNQFAGPPRFPDGLCIGARQSGISWLHAALQSHPAVWQCPISEFHHFDWDARDPVIGAARQRQALAMIAARAGTNDDTESESIIRMALRHAFPPTHDWQNYAATFESTPTDRLAIDFTPAYADLAPSDVKDIARVMPSAKILYILRENAQPAVSGASHQRSQRSPQTSSTPETLRTLGPHPANVTRSDHLRTIDTWRQCFPSEQIRVLSHEDLVRDPLTFVDEVCRFFGIGPHPAPEAFIRGRAPTARTDPTVQSAASGPRGS